MLDVITENIDIWSSALILKSGGGKGRSKKDELTAHGVKKLRELILEMAVRGKLVSQDPNDEPASVLLDRIAKEKAQLIKDGKIKKQKSLPDISDNEKPFELPNGWVFARFGNITFNRDSERIPLSVDERKTRQGNYDYYGASGVIDTIDGYLFDKPLLLIGEDGANLINRSTPIAFIARGKYWVNNHAHVIDGVTEDFLLYLCLHINAISLEQYVTGTAQPKMNQAKMNTILINLPPLAEQKRIVAKVDELIVLCDQLERAQSDNDTAHQTLVETLLGTLTASDDNKELQENWSRIEKYFDTLFITEYSIEQLKQTILQLAVMGKFVPQEPNEQPASMLLKQITKEKTRLIMDGKVKKQKTLPTVSDDEKPFTIPKSWEWTRLGNISLINPRNEAKDKTLVSFVPMHLISTSHTGDHGQEEREWESVKKGYTHFADGDIGLAKITPCFENSKAVVFSNLLNGIGAGTTELHIARPYCETLYPRYILLYLKTPKFLLVGKAKMTGTAGQKRLPKHFFSENPLPLPPLNEQHRIVSKVDELMVLCNALKSKISNAQTTQAQFAGAIVEKAVAF